MVTQYQETSNKVVSKNGEFSGTLNLEKSMEELKSRINDPAKWHAAENSLYQQYLEDKKRLTELELEFKQSQEVLLDKEKKISLLKSTVSQLQSKIEMNKKLVDDLNQINNTLKTEYHRLNQKLTDIINLEKKALENQIHDLTNRNASLLELCDNERARVLDLDATCQKLRDEILFSRTAHKKELVNEKKAIANKYQKKLMG